MKNIRIFYLKIFSVLVVEFSIYLNRHILLMLYDMIRSPDKGVFRIFFLFFCTKTSLVGAHWNGPTEAISMNTKGICFSEKITKIVLSNPNSYN